MSYPGTLTVVPPTDPISNHGGVQIADSSNRGFVFIHTDNGDAAIVLVMGVVTADGNERLAFDYVYTQPAGAWGTTSGEVGKQFNVFTDGQDNYRVQNASRADRRFYIHRAGTFTNA